jgi:hypothetical protein
MVVKLDSLGNIEWQKVIGANGGDGITAMSTASDGGYICGVESGSTASCDKTEPLFGGYTDIWVLKLDSLGNLQWQFATGGDSYDQVSSIKETPDGGFVLGGSTGSGFTGRIREVGQGNYDAIVIKLDSSGILKWMNLIGGKDSDQLYSIVVESDNSFVCGAISYSDISGDKADNTKWPPDYWVFKVSAKYNSIEGRIFSDFNFNFNFDSSDVPMRNCKVIDSNSGRIAFSGYNGSYSLDVPDSGNYIVSTSSNISWYSQTPSINTAYFSGFSQTDSFNDFVFQPAGSFDDLCMTITPLGQFRPGFNGSYMLSYDNAGTTTQSPKIVFRIFPNTNFVSSSLTPSAVYPDSVVWNLPPLSPLQSGHFFVTIHLTPSLPIGSILNSYAQIFPVVNDVNPSCNNATWEVTVRGSYDPNDILVDQDTLYSFVFPNPPFLDYIIRFQNVGNDTAFAVKILNPIDTMKLDLNSLEFVAASHPMEMRFIYHERNMEFLFNNILLPDSNVNEPASHGFVRYKIKPKSNLQIGDSIQNFAAIYFDFNEPVITNTAKTHILLFTGLAEQINTSELFVYPNPSSQEINIQVSNTQGKRISLDVYNLFGQKVKSLFDGKIMSSELKQQFDISYLNQGVYLLQYIVDGVTKSKKIIKW